MVKYINDNIPASEYRIDESIQINELYSANENFFELVFDENKF